MNKKPYIIFFGSASTKLAKKLAVILKLPTGKKEIVRFANSEYRLRILTKVKDKNCIIVQSTCNPVNDNLMELFLLIDTLKRSDARGIIAVIPYFGYSRQHKNFRQGECVSAEMILKILVSLGANKIITLDFHNLKNTQNFPNHFKNVSALPLMARVVAKKVDISNSVVVSPDVGGYHRAQIFANHLFNKRGVPVLVIKKQRDLNQIHKIKHGKLINNVKILGKTVIIIDDICTTGKTLLSAVNICVQQGAKQIYAVVTHPDMDSSVVDMIDKSQIVRFYTTNSIEYFNAVARNSKKIRSVDISKILTKAEFAG